MKPQDREHWNKNKPQDKGASNCPFCSKSEAEREYIKWKGKYWIIIHNKYPILGLDTHLMAIPKRHVKFAHDLNSEEMVEYPKVEKYIFDFFGEERYFTFMRESLRNRSLEHIHYHFLPGQIGYEDIEHFLQKQGY